MSINFSFKLYEKDNPLTPVVGATINCRSTAGTILTGVTSNTGEVTFTADPSTYVISLAWPDHLSYYFLPGNVFQITPTDGELFTVEAALRTTNTNTSFCSVTNISNLLQNTEYTLHDVEYTGTDLIIGNNIIEKHPEIHNDYLLLLRNGTYTVTFINYERDTISWDIKVPDIFNINATDLFFPLALSWTAENNTYTVNTDEYIDIPVEVHYSGNIVSLNPEWVVFKSTDTNIATTEITSGKLRIYGHATGTCSIGGYSSNKYRHADGSILNGGGLTITVQ